MINKLLAMLIKYVFTSEPGQDRRNSHRVALSRFDNISDPYAFRSAVLHLADLVQNLAELNVRNLKVHQLRLVFKHRQFQ